MDVKKTFVHDYVETSFQISWNGSNLKNMWRWQKLRCQVVNCLVRFFISNRPCSHLWPVWVLWWTCGGGRDSIFHVICWTKDLMSLTLFFQKLCGISLSTQHALVAFNHMRPNIAWTCIILWLWMRKVWVASCLLGNAATNQLSRPS